MGEGIRSSLLLELDRDGRFGHLELSTPAGLLTLHPEGDGTLHGNAVTPTGIDHLRGLPWAPEIVIELEGSAVCRAVAASHGGGRLEVLSIALDLSLRRVEVDVDPNAATADGLPNLSQGNSWPLDDAS